MVDGILLIATLMTGAAAPATTEPRPVLETVLGTNPDGGSTEQWLAMIRKRLPAAEYAGFAKSVRQLTQAERGWADLIGSHVSGWQARLDRLRVPFRPVSPPRHVLIVMGNRGGNDAFTHDPVTIGFDLSALQDVYGDASLDANAERIDRLFDHEYTHLLQKAWLAVHPYTAGTPQREALLDIWLEGLGQYRSLSARWRAAEGENSRAAGEALARLEPRFAARLAALACASDEDARALTADLSQGRFDQKWGALTAALWLEAEAGRDQAALAAFVRAGPDEVWNLAARHMPDTLAAVLAEARAAASVCAAGVYPK